jgi:RsiW-degrading membrane proteinase PrsW (M82 family)
MLQGLLTLPVIVPVLFWAAYHYHKDRHLPEPPGNLFLCIAMGVGASFVSSWFYEALEPFGLRYDAVELAGNDALGLFAYAMLVIGPVEELAKILPFLLVVTRFREFDEPLDGIIYASFIGLGYAAAENVYYLQFLSPLEAVARGFASPVIHMLFASIWGHWIIEAHLSGRSKAKAALAGFLIAAAAHGVYDFIVLLQPRFALPVAAIMIAAIWIWRLKLMHAQHLDAVEASREDE